MKIICIRLFKHVRIFFIQWKYFHIRSTCSCQEHVFLPGTRDHKTNDVIHCLPSCAWCEQHIQIQPMHALRYNGFWFRSPKAGTSLSRRDIFATCSMFPQRLPMITCACWCWVTSSVLRSRAPDRSRVPARSTCSWYENIFTAWNFFWHVKNFDIV